MDGMGAAKLSPQPYLSDAYLSIADAFLDNVMKTDDSRGECETIHPGG